MKRLLSFLLLASTTALLADSEPEPFVVSLDLPWSGQALAFDSAYQIGSTVYVLWTLEGEAGPLTQWATLTASELLPAPAIAAEHVIVGDALEAVRHANPWVQFVDSREDVAGIEGAVEIGSSSQTAYDPKAGDGWVLSSHYAWLYLRHYPWIWLHDIGEWVYVEPLPEAEGGNAYWLYVREGWSFVSDMSYPSVYRDEKGWRRGFGGSSGTSTVTEVFSGIRLWHHEQRFPRLLNINLLEIDLSEPGISFLVSPRNGTPPSENSVQTTREFVASVGAQAGINATFFYYEKGFYNRGLVASLGNVYSPFEASGWPVLNISQDNEAAVLPQYLLAKIEPGPSDRVYNAVSGSEQIVLRGVNRAGREDYGEPFSLHPRTVAGVTEDNRLFLGAIDGRRPGFTEGMRSTETADLLIKHGVYNAINLDGGGSTTMVIADPQPWVVNRVSGSSEREVAVSLAVFAEPSTEEGNARILADYYLGERGGFATTPLPSRGVASSGILKTSTNETLEDPTALGRGWLQRLTLRDAPSDGGWFVRHWYAPGYNGNVHYSKSGWIGFWARTTDEGIRASIAIGADGWTRRAVSMDLIPDGEWHVYEWSLDESAQWRSWLVNDTAPGNGGEFELDSILFYGPDADAVIDIDRVVHHSHRSITSILPADVDAE